MTLKHSPSANGKAYSILIDASNRPLTMIGRITPQVTKGRPSPPVPFSGFNTNYTPFDRGHIVALELNGPDISENIVPQYRMWQQSGAWRQNEVALSRHAQAGDAIFVAELSYTGHPDTYSAQQKRFQNNEIFDWTDKRIPDTFDIWFIAASDALAKDIEKDLLTNAKATQNEFDNCVLAIRKTKTYIGFTHSKMPAEDVEFWKSIQIGVAFHTVFKAYEAQRESDVKAMKVDLQKNPPMDNSKKPAKKLLSPKEEQEVVDVTRSPLREDVEFAMTQGDPIKKELESTYGWSKTETTALSNGKVVQSVFGNQTQKQATAQAKRHKEYEDEYAKKQKVKKDFEHKGVVFKGTGYTGTTNY